MTREMEISPSSVDEEFCWLLDQIGGQPRTYYCGFCKRGFSNAQALGGHMNVHRTDRAKLKQSCEELSLGHYTSCSGSQGKKSYGLNSPIYRHGPERAKPKRAANDNISLFSLSFEVDQDGIELSLGSSCSQDSVDLELRLGRHTGR